MKNKYTPFQAWFVTFCEEKQIDLSEPVPCTEGILQVGDVCSVIMNCHPKEQAQIKNTLVVIDFKNGDVIDFFKFLALKLDQSHKAELII